MCVCVCGLLITVHLVKVFGGHREGLGGLTMLSVTVWSHMDAKLSGNQLLLFKKAGL